MNNNIEEKRELVYELSKMPNGPACEILQSWSRQEILQILCSELGKERKYTGLTKLKIIEHLLKIVSDKKKKKNEIRTPHDEPLQQQKASSGVRQRTSRGWGRLSNSLKLNVDINNCNNSACRAALSPGDIFCRRCSCCICHKFDDNKDPSLWFICTSDPPFQGNSCNMSCHLECALNHNRSGLVKKVPAADGSFYCVSCGKINDLLRCCRKQLAIAKETRRLDILCYRVSLTQRLLLSGSKKHISNLIKIVEEAVLKLQAEVGPLLSGVTPAKTGRGIVNRTSSGQEVQRLCSSAVELLDTMLSEMTTQQQDQSDSIVSLDCYKALAVNIIRIEDTTATLALGPTTKSKSNVRYALWHRKADDDDKRYINSSEPTCTISPPETRFFVSGLSPSTEYIFKVACFEGARELSSSEVRLTTTVSNSSTITKDVHVPTVLERSQSPVTNCSTLSDPSSVDDETNNNLTCSSIDENKRVDNCLKFNGKAGMILDPTVSAASEPADPNRVSTTPHLENINNSLLLQGPNVDVDVDVDVEEETSPPPSSNNNGSKTPTRTDGMEILPSVQQQRLKLPSTPCRSDILVGRKGIPKNIRENGTEGQGSSALKKKKRSRGENELEEEDRCNPSISGAVEEELELEQCVKLMRCLETEGHIEKSFRQKFLSWYSLRATPRELRVVKAFVDILIQDPASLAEQLLDAFGDIVVSSCNRSLAPPPPPPLPPPAGFCMKLWH